MLSSPLPGNSFASSRVERDNAHFSPLPQALHSSTHACLMEEITQKTLRPAPHITTPWDSNPSQLRKVL